MGDTLIVAALSDCIFGSTQLRERQAPALWAPFRFEPESSRLRYDLADASSTLSHVSVFWWALVSDRRQQGQLRRALRDLKVQRSSVFGILQ